MTQTTSHITPANDAQAYLVDGHEWDAYSASECARPDLREDIRAEMWAMFEEVEAYAQFCGGFLEPQPRQDFISFSTHEGENLIMSTEVKTRG